MNRYEIRDRECSERRAHIWEVYDTHTPEKKTVARFYDAGRAERHRDEANRVYRKRSGPVARYLAASKGE